MKIWLVSLFTCLSSVLYASSDTLTLFNRKMSYMAFYVTIKQVPLIDTISIDIKGGNSDIIHIRLWDETCKVQYVDQVYIIDSTNHVLKVKLPSNKPHVYSIDIGGNKDGTLFTEIRTK